MSDLKLSEELRQISYGNSRHIDLTRISQLADKAIVIEDKLEAMEQDETRLNWLETEGRREDIAMLGKLPVPNSLFRANMPITRKAIDEALAAAQQEQGK